MPSFSYRAVDGGGKPVSGVLTAENYQVALRLLDEQSLFPVKVAEGTNENRSTLGVGRRRVKTQHLTMYYTQLADLLKAGVPMLRSLDVLAKQKTRGSLPQIVKELREDVAGGTSLGDAMAKHPSAFSILQSSMVRAGEAGGFLEEVLERIAIFSERQDDLRKKVVGAMIYPAILVFVGTAIVLMIMIFLVPKLGEHLRVENYNFMTHIVMGIADFLKTQTVMIIFGVSALIASASTFMRTDYGRRAFAVLKLRAPVMGPILTMVAICRFCRILGTLLHNGVQILQALRIAKDSAGNLILEDVIENALESVKKGAPLSTPLRESGLFPDTIVDMISVAEESNNLEAVLVQIADTNEARTSRAIDLGVRVLEPILLVFMAFAVLCIMVALLLPILTMGSGV